MDPKLLTQGLIEIELFRPFGINELIIKFEPIMYIVHMI